MAGPLIAIVGDVNPTRTFAPAMSDPAKARRAAEELGAELGRRGARLLVYGDRSSRRTPSADSSPARRKRTGAS